MKKLFRIPRFLIVALPLLAAACSGTDVRDTLGLNRDAPDEFTVLSRPPLSMPPDFTLRPPHAGSDLHQPSADEQARDVMLGKSVAPATPVPNAKEMLRPTVDTAVTPVVVTNTPSHAEASFLNHAGASAANENIRDQLGTDAVTPVDTSKSKTLYEKLSGQDKTEPVVDPQKETERLRENKDEGKPVTAGDTPTQTESPKSFLDYVF
jgi:hypothetical protein